MSNSVVGMVLFKKYILLLLLICHLQQFNVSGQQRVLHIRDIRHLRLGPALSLEECFLLRDILLVSFFSDSDSSVVMSVVEVSSSASFGGATMTTSFQR